MLPPPPKRTRAVAPESGTTSETSNLLPPPPSSRDRRNRRTATNTQTAPFPTANPFLPQPSLFTPLAPITPFIPTSSEDDTPDCDNGAAIEADSTPQIDEAIVSPPATVNGSSHISHDATEVVDNDVHDNTQAIEEIKSDEPQKEQFMESEVSPSQPESDAPATPSDMVTDGWRDEDPESASYNPELSHQTATDSTMISSDWGDDPETFGEASTFEPDLAHSEEPFEVPQSSEESNPVEKNTEQLDDAILPVIDAEAASQSATWDEEGHEMIMEEEKTVTAPSEALFQEDNLLSSDGQTTAAEFDDWGQDEDDLAPIDTSMETHATHLDQDETVDTTSPSNEASSLPLAPTESAFGDWGEDPEDSFPTTSLSTTQDQDEPDLRISQDDPSVSVESHSEYLHESVEQGAPLTDAAMASQDSNLQETPTVTTTVIEPSSEQIDFGFGDESLSTNEQAAQEEPLPEATDAEAAPVISSATGFVELGETETERSSSLAPPQSQDFGDWDDSFPSAEVPSEQPEQDLEFGDGWNDEIQPADDALKAHNVDDKLESPLELDSALVPVEPHDSASNRHEEIGIEAQHVGSQTEEHYDDEFCEIDSTSRSVLASLHPVDTTMHSIIEAADETSSTASEVTPRQVSLGFSNPTLPSIPENSSSFENDQFAAQPSDFYEDSDALHSSNPDVPAGAEEDLLLDDSTQLQPMPIHIEPASGDLFLDSSSEHQDEPASPIPEHHPEELIIEEVDQTQTGDEAVETSSEQLLTDSISEPQNALDASALPSSSNEDLVFDNTTQIQPVGDEPDAPVSDEPLFEDTLTHEPIASDGPFEGGVESDNAFEGTQTVPVAVSDDPIFDDSLSLNADTSIPSSSEEHISFDIHVQSKPVSYEEGGTDDIEFEATLSVSIEVTEPEDDVVSSLVQEELLRETSSLNGSVSISEDLVLENEDDLPQTPSFVDEPSDIVTEVYITQIIEEQDLDARSSHSPSKAPPSDLFDVQDTNVQDTIDTTNLGELETGSAQIQDEILATSSDAVATTDASVEDQLYEEASDGVIGQEIAQGEAPEDSLHATTTFVEVDASQGSEYHQDAETVETQEVDDAVAHEDVAEDDVVYAELQPAEAESMFNQYKQSLKEHQDTLKQLLDEREVMRLELQTVMLHYGPMHELHDRLASLKLEYDELSHIEVADETVASELTDLADTIYHYETAIQRRQEESESQKSSHMSQSTPTEQRSAYANVSTPESSLPLPSHELGAAAYVPETSTQYIEDIEDLKLRLKERDEEIEAHLLQITHLKVHVSTLEEQLTKLKESESESEIVQVELRREVEEAQKVIDRLLQQESLATQYADTIAKLEQELSQVKEDAQKQADAAVASSLELDVESFVFDGSEPIETVNAKISDLLLQKAQSIVEVQQLKVEVNRLVEKLTSTERRMSIEVSALDSQLVERETENSILREKLSAATVSEMSPEVQSEMAKIQKGYELTKSHLTKCEKELEEAVSRANELDQLWKTECQLRTELQLQHQVQKHHPHNRTGSNPSSPFKTANGSPEQAKLKEQAMALLDSENKIAELESILSDRDERSSSLEKELERLRRAVEGLEAKGHESARSASKQAAIIDGLRQQLNSVEVEAASKTFDHEAALNEDLAMKNLRIEELEIELKALMQSNESLTSEIGSLKSTLSKLDQRYQELRHQQQTSDKDESIADLRAENRSLLEQLNSVTGEKNVHVSELQSELESVQRALEAVQTEMLTNTAKKPESLETASPRNSNDVAVIDELTTELQMLKAQLDQNTQSFETSQDRINELESTVSTSQREQEHARSQLSKALSDATQEKARVKDLSAQVSDKVQLVKDLEMELEAASAAHITSISRINDLEATVLNQKAEIAEIESQLDRQQADLADLRSDNASLVSAANASSEKVQVLERTLQEANSKLQETLVALAKSEAEYSSLASELEMTRMELREAQEARDKAVESAANAAPEHNEEDLSTIASLKAELARKDSLMYEAYAAFEGEMGYMAQEMESQWKEKLERATTASSKAALPDPSVSEALEKRIVQLEEELEQARLVSADVKQQSETEKQALQSKFDSDMAVLREESESLANQLQNVQAASSEAELKHLEEMDALALQVASMEEKLASTASQFANAQLQLSSKSSEEVSTSHSEIVALQDQVASLNEIVAESERTIEQYANDLDSLKQEHELALEKASQANELDAVKSSHQQLLQDYASLESQHAALLESQQAMELELERVLSQSSEQASSASEYASKLQEFESRLQNAHEERLKLMKQREEERQAEKDTMQEETTALSSEVTRLTRLAQQRNEEMLESSAMSTKAQEELAAAHSVKAELESELALMSSKVDSLAQDLAESRSQIDTLRSENSELQAAAEEARQRSSASDHSSPLVLNTSTAPVETTSAPLDDWGNDDGWDTSSPVEQQAELEYLRSFLKSKSKEVDELKLQLAQATHPKPVPAVENLRPTSSLPTSPYVAPARVSSPSLAPIPLEPSDAKDLFGDDGGWDDLEFEPLPASSTKTESAPVAAFDSSVHEEEIRELKAQLDLLKATEKQNESLKAALALRDGELEEGAEQYQELKTALEGLQTQVTQLESNLKDKEDELSQMASSAAAVPVSPPQPIKSSAEIQSIQAELDKANQTIKTLQSLLASKPAAAHIATTSLDFGSDEFEGDGWDNFGEEVDKKQASQVNSLERELETLRHISDQKDGNLSALRVEIASLKSTIAELESKATEPKEKQTSDLFESAEDVSSRISQAVEHERSQWKAEIQKVEDAYEQQIQNLELKHLTELEQAEFTAQETLHAKVDSAVVAAKSDNDSSLHKRLRDAEEIHQTQKDLLETQLAKLSADHQALDLKNNQLSSQLTTVLEQNKSLTATVNQLQNQISELSSTASHLVTLKEQNEQLRLQCEELRSTQLGDNQSLADELESLRSAREAAETSNMALKESYQLQLEEAQASRLDIETKLALNEQKLHEVQSAMETLRAESRSKQDLIHQKEVKIMDLQSRMNSDKQSQESTLLTAEEDAMTLRDENIRLKQQLDHTKKSVQALNVSKVEQENLIHSLKQQETRSAAQIKTYLARLEQLQALIDKPTVSASTWAEEQLLTQSAIAERLTTENAKLSKGLVSGLMDSQTPIERLAASKAQLQDRVDRLEKDLKRIKTELSARTEERDTLRTKVDTLSSERQDLKRQISASPAARYSSPAAHFASYAATPSSPFAPSIPYPASAPQNGAYPIVPGSTAI